MKITKGMIISQFDDIFRKQDLPRICCGLKKLDKNYQSNVLIWVYKIHLFLHTMYDRIRKPMLMLFVKRCFLQILQQFLNGQENYGLQYQIWKNITGADAQNAQQRNLILYLRVKMSLFGKCRRLLREKNSLIKLVGLLVLMLHYFFKYISESYVVVYLS